MRLSEMLIYADIEQLSQIAKRYQCVCNTHSKHELIQSILNHSYREDITANQLNLMSDQQKYLLSILLFSKNKKYSTEDLKAKIKYCKFSEPEPIKDKRKKIIKSSLSLEESIIKQLKDEGWLFKEQGVTQHPLYDIPEDKSEYFRKYLAHQIKSQLTSFEHVTVVREEAGLSIADIKLMLQFFQLHTIALNGILLMGKRVLQQLLNSLHINEPIPGKGAWKFGYGKKFGEYPDRFCLLYQFAVDNEWLEEQANISLTAKGLDKITDLGEEDNIRLISYWLNIYKKPIPNIKAITYFLLYSLDTWRSVEELQLLLKPYLKAYYFDNEEAILHKRILKMLLHFGVIILGETDTDSLLLKLSPYGKEWLIKAINMNENGKHQIAK